MNNIQADAPFSSSLYGHCAPKWAVLPLFFRGLSKKLNCCASWGGGQEREENEDNNMRAARDSQSAIEFDVRICCVAANQHVRNCNRVSFGPLAFPVARIRSFGAPPADPSFPLGSRRFTSFLCVSRAYRLRSASNVGSGPPQAWKAGWIQADLS